MRTYAEQTWGGWNGRADLDLAFDQVVQLDGQDIGLFGVERRPDHWYIDKLYLLPSYQNKGLGSVLLKRVIDDARAAGVALRLHVLEVNPARRLYERHGFVLTHIVPPRRYMEWRGLPES